MGEMLTPAAEDGFKPSAYRANPGGKPRGALAIVQEIFERGSYHEPSARLARERAIEFLRRHVG